MKAEPLNPHWVKRTIGNLFAALNLLGVPTAFDPNDGLTAGAAFVPTDIDPNNQTRADARRSYFDPYATRKNFHVITGQQVTQILIEGNTGDNAASNPSTGGNVNGNGPAGGNTGGFGFGPGGGPPPTPPNEQGSASMIRRDPASSNLRVTGVEVRIQLWSSEPHLTSCSSPQMPPHHVEQFTPPEKLSLRLEPYIQRRYYNCQALVLHHSLRNSTLRYH